MKTAIVTANLGGFDNVSPHVEQSIAYDYHLFTDENFPPRHCAMTPRMQARMPKCFAYEMVPGYDYYLWIDGNLTLKHNDSLKHFFDKIEGHDLVVLNHDRRPDIRQETRYIRKAVRQQSKYIVKRYENELLAEQYKFVCDDKDYVDDTLYMTGVFLYKNTPKVQAAMKEWWHFVSRYHIVDQIGFVYAMRKAGLKINALDDKYTDCWYLGVKRHG